MTAGPLRLTGFSRGTHVEVVSRTRDALGSAGASILDFHMFSNSILCLNFEIAAARLTALGAAIGDAGVRLDSDSLTALDAAANSRIAPTVENPDGRVEGSLSINLINDEPALRIEVPAVPG